nr:ralBP1-associated Eps domain-containing protein 1-like [Ciona intestinalis]|eukprot:XP_002130969.1 ralBP1-associated Eps domain-containing protein 1-like [Ciona intestinalis]
MESQSVPRPQAIQTHLLHKGSRLPKPKLSSPPTSPTAPHNPNLPTNSTLATPSQVQNRAWTSFDDSPVHLNSAGNNFASPSPWSSGPGNDKWASFPNRKSEDQKDSNSTPVSSNLKRTSDHTHPSQNPNTPVQGVPLTHPLASNTPLKPHARTPNQPGYSVETPTQIRHRNPSKEDIIGHKQALDGSNEFTDPWCITDEQREYYMKQFSTMQPDLKGKIDGQTARNFFTKSKLPILELSHIWELSDMDQDGSLTIDEFCTAFHLVVARKNGYDLPIKLPQALVPTLIDLGVGEVPTKADPFQPDEEISSHPIASNNTASADQWETFSDRTNSSTTLANFDQSNHSIEENLPHPVAVHMTPSRHPELWKRVSNDAEKSSGATPSGETHDEESTTSSPQVRTKKRLVTNPYGSLRNELSDVDSSCEGKKLSASNSTDSKESRNNELEEKTFRKNKKGRSLSTSSVTSSSSSVATSDRSSADEDDVEDRSDPEHSDWSSRPLRPRSGSSSSMESGSVPTITPLPPPAPTPPPRPLVHPKSSPKLKRESKSNSLERNENFPTKDVENRVDGPTPPPRPQTVPVTEPQESFADFSNFNQPHEEPEPIEKSDDEKKIEKKLEKKVEKKVEKIVKPVPAPRPNKESAKIEEEIENKDIEEEKSTHNKKAPTKPPRSRIMSSDVCKPEPILSTLPISSKDPKHKPQPKQELSRNKSSLQTSIRELKVRNTQLTRLNADLQQQLKDVMESRITVEMNIHQMRPFTQ